MEQNVLVKGLPEKNKVGTIVLSVAAGILVLAFVVAFYVFEYCEGYEYFGFGYGGWYYWCVIYDSFPEFYSAEFFNFACYYGYITILGILALIAGILIRALTEKCQITVTDTEIQGTLVGGKQVTIPVNQVNAIQRASFNGVTVGAIGRVCSFYCFSNREEIMKAMAYLLANMSGRQSAPQHVPQSAPQSAAPAVGIDAEKLLKMKQLLDAGILTQEEFDAKKKELLEL